MQAPVQHPPPNPVGALDVADAADAAENGRLLPGAASDDPDLHALRQRLDALDAQIAANETLMDQRLQLRLKVAEKERRLKALSGEPQGGKKQGPLTSFCMHLCDGDMTPETFWIQVIVSFIVLIWLIVMLSTSHETQVYLPVLTGIVGYWLPSPSPKKAEGKKDAHKKEKPEEKPEEA